MDRTAARDLPSEDFRVFPLVPSLGAIPSPCARVTIIDDQHAMASRLL